MAVKEKRPYSVEFRFYHTDGSIRWMEGRGEAVYSDRGEPVRLYGIGLDITKRKESDERLRESEERFRLSLSSGALTVYEQDRDLKYRWLFPSEPYSADYIGKTDEELAPGSHGKNLTKLKRQVLESGKPLRAEVSAPVGGKERWFDLLVEPRIDATGNVIGVVGTALDITIRKNAEQQLKRQAVLMDAALEPVIAWEFGGNIIDWNRGAERAYGYTAEEAIGKITHQLLQTGFPISFEEIEKELKRSGSWIGELKHTTKSGETIIVESRQQLIEVGDRMLVLEANRDITERKRVSEELQRSEARLQAMFDSTTVGIAVLDLDYRFLQINDAFCNITGYSRPELLDIDWTVLTQTGDLANINIGVERLKNGEVSHLTFEKQFLGKIVRWCGFRAAYRSHVMRGVSRSTSLQLVRTCQRERRLRNNSSCYRGCLPKIHILSFVSAGR